jgi:excisionase family DNA binding protein
MTNTEMPSPWLTVKEAAAWSKVSEATILRWTEDKSLKAHKTIRDGLTRGIVRIKVSELDALLEGTTKGTTK